MPQLLVFTDVDGTLLDHETYQWEAARPALEELKAQQVPVILCTSKTWAEVLPLRETLGLEHPFVVENGGAIYFPVNYFPNAPTAGRAEAGFQVVELGVRYPRLVRALEEEARASGVKVRGFSRMTEEEVGRLCGLSPAAARRARQREYDEPFLIEQGGRQQKEDFFHRLRERGLRWRAGGRFLHLLGGSDKGKAVTRLLELYRSRYGALRSVGLGDSPNDLDFLAEVDIPVLVARPDGSHDATLCSNLPHARLAPGIGPVGWNQ
ncbi:MAG: HAD-IIB family hydrolase, partial [Terriglobia bacterium]